MQFIHTLSASPYHITSVTWPSNVSRASAPLSSRPTPDRKIWRQQPLRRPRDTRASPGCGGTRTLQPRRRHTSTTRPFRDTAARRRAARSTAAAACHAPRRTRAPQAPRAPTASSSLAPRPCGTADIRAPPHWATRACIGAPCTLPAWTNDGQQKVRRI